MEAAKPIELETNKDLENNVLKIIDTKKFDITLNNKKYIFEFSKTENSKYIIFKISENNNFIDKYFSLNLNIDNFYGINVLFRLYQSIDEIYTFLLDIIIAKKYSVVFKDNIIILNLEFPMPGGKIIDINFELKENKIEKDNLIQKLYESVDTLLKENKLIKDEQILLRNELKNKNEELEKIKNENIEIKYKLKDIEEFIEKKREEDNKKFFDLNKSYIMTDREEKKRIKKWINAIAKIKSINLLYKASENGDNSYTFFEKCGNKGATLSLIKTKKGRRFGGFSKIEWTNSIIKLKDKHSFLFSLDEMKKYKILKPENAISCYPGGYCLVYGNNEDCNGIYLHDGFLSRSSKENHASRVYNVPSDCCLSGEREFNVEEVEVYQIEFET